MPLNLESLARVFAARNKAPFDSDEILRMRAFSQLAPALYGRTQLPPSLEQRFQSSLAAIPNPGIRAMRQRDAGTDGDVDLRGAFLYGGGRSLGDPHMGSRYGPGFLMKRPDHPTFYKEAIMSQTHKDPDADFGQPISREDYESEISIGALIRAMQREGAFAQ